jgi:hypothetical protein
MSKETFIQTTIDGLAKLTRLDVNTLVGNYTFTTDSTIKNDSTAERMCSQINLLSGDITTAMTEKFVSDYKELREYHMTRESQGHEIVKQNIAVLKDILAAIVHFSKPEEK